MTELFHDTGVWLLLSFAIFAYIVWSKGKDAVLGALDSRIEGIRRDLDTAENLRIEAQELLAQYQRKHRDALQESERIISDAKKRSEQIRKDAEAELEELVTRREQQLQERLDRMKDTAEREIRVYASNIVVEATEQLIADTIKKKDQTQLIDTSIQTVSKEIH